LGKRRKVSPPPEEGSEQDESDSEEDVRRAVTGSGGRAAPAAGRKSSGSAKRRAVESPVEDAAEGEEGEGVPDDDGQDAFNFDDDAGNDGEDADQPDEGDEEEPAPSNKKGKGRKSNTSTSSAKPAAKAKQAAKRKAASTGPKPQVTKVARKRLRDETEDPDGVRRSARQRIEPLEYWRNERALYKRRASGMGLQAVVRIPKEQAESLAKRKGHHHAKRGGSSRVKSEMPPEEEGVDDMTDPDGLVMSYETQAETVRRAFCLRTIYNSSLTSTSETGIAFTQKMMDPQPAYDRQFGFQKIFTELDYLAGGILHIPTGCAKASKPARDNSYVSRCCSSNSIRS
jgi:centromere protein C